MCSRRPIQYGLTFNQYNDDIALFNLYDGGFNWWQLIMSKKMKEHRINCPDITSELMSLPGRPS